MNTCEITSHRTRPMLPSMRMHEGSLNTQCNSWPNGSSWPWSQPELSRNFFFCERLSASMARSLQLSFICIPQSARALDQGGVEPRQAVSPKALRPWTARAITKARAPDFLFLHEKDFWFKQIWVDLHQTMVLDREGSYTRPVLGLVRCVCKDETEQTGRTSPIKMRICNLHFFASIWVAQSVIHNFRRMSMTDLKPREPGYIVYKEGWYEWDGRV